jgi:hypothetical protein
MKSILSIENRIKSLTNTIGELQDIITSAAKENLRLNSIINEIDSRLRVKESNEESSNATLILPSWFTQRMMEDSWQFGLMLSNGTTIAISGIKSLHLDASGGIWIDVYMLDYSVDDLYVRTKELFYIWTSPTSRVEATINAAHVIAAFEIADT